MHRARGLGISPSSILYGLLFTAAFVFGWLVSEWWRLWR